MNWCPVIDLKNIMIDMRQKKKQDDWWSNIGLYFGKEIPLEDSFEAVWGETISLTRYLKDWMAQIELSRFFLMDKL